MSTISWPLINSPNQQYWLLPSCWKTGCYGYWTLVRPFYSPVLLRGKLGWDTFTTKPFLISVMYIKMILYAMVHFSFHFDLTIKDSFFFKISWSIFFHQQGMILFLLGSGFIFGFFVGFFFFSVVVACIFNFDVNWSHFKSIHPPWSRCFLLRSRVGWGAEESPMQKETTLAIVHSGQFQLFNSPLLQTHVLDPFRDRSHTGETCQLHTEKPPASHGIQTKNFLALRQESFMCLS